MKKKKWVVTNVCGMEKIITERKLNQVFTSSACSRAGTFSHALWNLLNKNSQTSYSTVINNCKMNKKDEPLQT